MIIYYFKSWARQFVRSRVALEHIGLTPPTSSARHKQKLDVNGLNCISLYVSWYEKFSLAKIIFLSFCF